MGQNEWREGRSYRQNQEKILPGRRSSICQRSRGGECVLRLLKALRLKGATQNREPQRDETGDCIKEDLGKAGV